MEAVQKNLNDVKEQASKAHPFGWSNRSWVCFVMIRLGGSWTRHEQLPTVTVKPPFHGCVIDQLLRMMIVLIVANMKAVHELMKRWPRFPAQRTNQTG